MTTGPATPVEADTPRKNNTIVSLRRSRTAQYTNERINLRKFTMAEAVLSLEDAQLTLSGNAGAVEILKGISLDVARGETLGLVGPSGSGKSSLLMLMGGLERATGGQVHALGQELTTMNEDALARFRLSHMGVVFQSFHLIPTMTALENVATPLELAGRKDAFERAEAELRAIGLGTRLDHYPSQLSGG